MRLAALSAIAASLALLSGCASMGSGGGRGVPLAVATDQADPQVRALVEEIRYVALQSKLFRPARQRDGAKTVSLAVESVVQPVTVRGEPGMTYQVAWRRDGIEIGKQKDECVYGKLRPCAEAVVNTMGVALNR